MKTNLEEKNVKTHIEIEGVILTSELLKCLKGFQDHDNEELDSLANVVAEAVCFIGSNIYMFHDHQDEERKEALQVISDLSIVRENLKKLKKP